MTEVKESLNEKSENALLAKLIRHIAQVSAAIGAQAGIGASETAGCIISVLAANPHIIDRFMAEGTGVFIDGPVTLDAANGCLTYLAQNGEILSPGELHRRRHGNHAFQ